MKLVDLETFVIGTPPPGWGGRYWLIVKLTADNGVTGYGEVYAASVGPKAMVAVIEDVFQRHMQGTDPHAIELMFRRVYSSGFTQRPDLTVMGAFSGLEIACWDLIGKAHDMPVHQMLGGRINDRLRAYTYLYPMAHHDPRAFWSSPEMQAESALEALDQGFTAIKFDPAGPYTIRGGHQPALFDIDLSVRMCAALRKAVGNRADLLFGTHGQFTPSGAIRLGQALEPYAPLWYEEPIPPDNLLDFAQVAQAVRIPLATGERMTTKAEFGTLLRSGGASILQPALGRSGGILETKKIAAMAEAFGAQVAPHLYAGPVEWAANVQLGATLPNLLLVESIQTGGTFHRALIRDTLKVEDGYIRVPTTPGLGIDFDEALARAHPDDGAGLHLQMQEAPVSYQAPNAFQGGAPRD